MIEVMLVVTLFLMSIHAMSWFFEAAAGDFRDWITVTGLLLLLSFVILLISIALS